MVPPWSSRALRIRVPLHVPAPLRVVAAGQRVAPDGLGISPRQEKTTERARGDYASEKIIRAIELNQKCDAYWINIQFEFPGDRPVRPRERFL